MKRLFALALLAACGSPQPRVAAPPPVAKEAGFWSKHIDLGAIPIRAHASVLDEGLAIARERLARMLEHAPRIRRNLEANRFEVHVSGLRQQMSDVPEFTQRKGERLPNGQLFDEHMIGGHIVAHITVCTEATLIGVVGHRLYGNDSCTHELAHGIEVTALAPSVRERILRQWERSVAAGRWQNEYARTSYAEMFAEATRFYFTDRALIESRDPELFALVRDLYTDAIDPGPAPVEQTIRPGPASDEGRVRSEGTRTPVRVRVRNDTDQELRVQWLDFDGKRSKPPAGNAVHAGGDTVELFTFVRHVFVVMDRDEKAVATITVPDSDAFVALP